MSGREDQLAETTCGHIRQNERPNRPAPIPCLTPVRPGPIPIATQHEHEHEHDETEMTRALKCTVFVSSISPHAPRNETPMPTTTNEDERRRTGTRRRRMRKQDGTGRPTTWDRNASRPAPRIARRDERGGTTARYKMRTTHERGRYSKTAGGRPAMIVPPCGPIQRDGMTEPYHRLPHASLRLI